MAARRRPTVVAVVALWWATLGLLIAAAVFTPVGDSSGTKRLLASIGFVALMAAVPTVGGLVVVRRPGNTVGWLLVATGPTWALLLAAHNAARHRVQTGGSVPGQSAWDWIEGWIGFVSFNALLPLLLLVFPTGRLLSRRWRAAAAVVVAGALAGTVGSAFAPGPLADFKQIDNPLGVSGAFGDVSLFLRDNIAWLLFAVGVLLALASLVVRFRRAGETERAQLKWMLLAAGLWVLVFPAWLLSPRTLGIPATELAVVALPVAIGVAVLRYRLYDIDRVISRTISYTLVSGVLAALFIGVVSVVSQLTPVSSQAGVAAATLVSAAAVNPLRRRIQRVVDRQFNRAPVDALRTVDSFNRGMHNEVDLEAMEDRLLTTVAGSLQPVSLSLWIAT